MKRIVRFPRQSKNIKIPVDVSWKTVIIRGVKRIVPDFNKMRNKIRCKNDHC